MPKRVMGVAAVGLLLVVGNGQAEAPATMNFHELSRGERTIAPRRAHRHPRVPRRLAPEAPAPVAPVMTPRADTAAAAPAFTGFPALLDNYTAVPADASGAVGPRHVMTMLNTEVLIQNRDGTRAKAAVSIDAFWSAITSGEAFDPRVLYDPFGRRWLATATVDSEERTAALVFAVSQTDDPTGNWNLFKIDLGANGLWGDYPLLAFNASWVAISVNLFALTTDSPYRRTELYILNKAELYNQAKATYATFSDTLGELIPAIDYDNTTPTRMLFLQAYAARSGSGVVRISEVRGSPGSETASLGLRQIQIADGWSGTATGGDDFLPQSGTSARLDAGDDRLQNCMLRNGTVWCAHTIFLPAGTPNRTAVQWFQIDPVRYQIVQRGRIDDPEGRTFYAYPSIAANRINDVLVGYNRFSATQFASANFSFREAADPANTMQADTLFKAGEASYSTTISRSNRWGDYGSTVVDPADDLTFWTIQVYAATPTGGRAGRWGTWWARVAPPSLASNCTFTISALAQLFQSAGGTGSLTVAAPAGCLWSASSNVPWLSITSGAQGSGAGNVAFSVGANGGALRSGTILVAGQTVTVTQVGTTALPDLVVTSISGPASAAAGARIGVSLGLRNQGGATAGAFRAGIYLTSGSSISTAGTLLGACTANGLGAGSTTSCSPTVTIPASLASGSYALAAIADDRGEVAEVDETNNARVADSRIIVSGVQGPTFPAAGVGNAAGYQSGAVAPGEIIVIFGTGLGPAALARPAMVNGVVGTVAGGTRVLFDGVAAPMVYARADQVSAVVPFGLASTANTLIQVEFNGVRSAAATLPVAASVPAIFTNDSSGRGQGAILNQDYSINGAGRAAPRGSVVMIFATGGGTLRLPVIDGALARAPYAELQLPVTVRIGGEPARVLYAGAAPGLINGALQINAVVPDGIAAGDRVPVELTVGPAASPAGVTMAVR